MLVEIGGLLALYMHPGEMTGDRMAQLLVALLIVVTNLQMDLGLGKLTALMWIDYFNLIQMALLIAAVIEGLIVHHYFTTQREHFAIHLDNVFRFLFPFIIYPFVTGGVVIWGAYQDATPFIVMIALGLPFFTILMFVMVKWNYGARYRWTKRCIAAVQLIERGAEDPRYESAMFELFRAVDLDASGALDPKELRELLKLLYPDAPRRAISDAIAIARTFFTSDGDLDDDSFVDALSAIDERLHDRLGSWSKHKLPPRDALSLSGASYALQSLGPSFGPAPSAACSAGGIKKKVFLEEERQEHRQMPRPETMPNPSSTRAAGGTPLQARRPSSEILAEIGEPVHEPVALVAPWRESLAEAPVAGATWDRRESPTIQAADTIRAFARDEEVEEKLDSPHTVPATLITRAHNDAVQREAEAAKRRRRRHDSASHTDPKKQELYATSLNF